MRFEIGEVQSAIKLPVNTTTSLLLLGLSECSLFFVIFPVSSSINFLGKSTQNFFSLLLQQLLFLSLSLSLPLQSCYNFDQSSAPMARPGNKIIQAKLVLLGDMGTGKTSLVLRFVKGQFFDNQEPTIGAAFFTQILSLSEATVKFDIWDTAGQERYHSLAPMYYRGAAAAVVVYDISSTETFTRAKKWVQELQRQGNLNLVLALVANKCDLEAKREVESEEGEQFAQENGMFFLETSAKTAQNINELFHEIAKRLAKAAPAKPARVNLNSETRGRRRMGFCCLG